MLAYGGLWPHQRPSPFHDYLYWIKLQESMNHLFVFCELSFECVVGFKVVWMEVDYTVENDFKFRTNWAKFTGTHVRTFLLHIIITIIPWEKKSEIIYYVFVFGFVRITKSQWTIIILTNTILSIKATSNFVKFIVHLKTHLTSPTHLITHLPQLYN